MRLNAQDNDVSFFNRYTSPINTAIFFVLFLLLPIVYSQQVFETASIPRHILVTGAACILLVFFSIQVFLVKIELKLSFLHIALSLFLFWALLSILWSVDVKNSITELTQLFIYFIIAFFASQLKNTQIKNIFFAIYIGASIAAIIGILQAFNFNPLDLKMTTPLASTFNNKNHASVFFDLVIPLALISMLTNKSYKKYIACITYTLAVTFILLARTKGSLLGFFIFTCFFLFFIYQNKSLRTHLLQKKKIIQYVLLSFIIPASVYTLTTFNFIDTQTPKHWNVGLTKSSTSIRLSWYKNAFAMLKEDLFLGVGYGAFRKGFAPYASNPNIVKSLTEDQAVAQLHNDPYQIFLELGLIGGSLIVLIFSYIIFKGFSLLIKADIKNKGSPNYILLGAYLAIISSLTHSFLDFPMRLPSSATLFWFLTGIITLFISKPKYLLNQNHLKIPVGIGMMFLSFILITHSYNLYSRYFNASKLTYNASVAFLKKHDCSQAISDIDQAMNLFFADAFIRQRYIQVYSSCNLSIDMKLSAMNRIIDYDQTNARARLNRATMYLEKRQLKLAGADFNYLVYVLPHRPAAYLGLGDIATLNKNYNKARKFYEKVKYLDSTNPKALFMLKQFSNKGV